MDWIAQRSWWSLENWVDLVIWLQSWWILVDTLRGAILQDGDEILGASDATDWSKKCRLLGKTIDAVGYFWSCRRFAHINSLDFGLVVTLWMWFIWFSMVLLGLRWWNGSSIWQEVLFVLVILFSWLLYCQFRVCWSFAAHLGDNGFLAGFGTLLIVYKCMLCGYWSILSFLIFRHWARFVASARDLLCCPWLVILLRWCLLLSFESIRGVCI